MSKPRRAESSKKKMVSNTARIVMSEFLNSEEGKALLKKMTDAFILVCDEKVIPIFVGNLREELKPLLIRVRMLERKVKDLEEDGWKK